MSTQAIADDNDLDKSKALMISEIHTAYAVNDEGVDVITLTIKGINFLDEKGEVPSISVGHNRLDYTVDSFNDNELVLTATLEDGDYLIMVSSDNKFKDEKTAFYDLTIGAVGPQGSAGADGTNGADGDMGAKGDTGATGAKGDTGAAGATGSAGTDGTNGTDGVSGKVALAGLMCGEDQYLQGFDVNGDLVCVNNSAGATVFQVGITGPSGGTVFRVSHDGLTGVEVNLNAQGVMTWNDANDTATAYAGWRLPTLEELDLIDQIEQFPKFDVVGEAAIFWSSELGAGDYYYMIWYRVLSGVKHGRGDMDYLFNSVFVSDF